MDVPRSGGVAAGVGQALLHDAVRGDRREIGDALVVDIAVRRDVEPAAADRFDQEIQIDEPGRGCGPLLVLALLVTPAASALRGEIARRTPT